MTQDQTAVWLGVGLVVLAIFLQQGMAAQLGFGLPGAGAGGGTGGGFTLFNPGGTGFTSLGGSC